MESDLHMSYVRVIARYIRARFPEEDCAFLETDLPESLVHPNRVLNGYRPDVFMSGFKYKIIGEAKTFGDINNRHTKEQLVSYVEELKTEDKERHLVICTSAMVLPALRTIIRGLARQYDFTGIHIHTMNDLNLNTQVWDL